MTPLYHATLHTFGYHLFLVFKKQCPLCTEFKFFDEFPGDAHTKDGCDPRCKQCRSDYHSQYRSEHKEQTKAYNTARQLDPVRRDAKLQQRHEAIMADPSRLQRDGARVKEYYAANPLKKREQAMRREARLYGAEIEKVDLAHILDQYGYICHICEGNIAHSTLCFDHVLPLSRGGAHAEWNIKPSHIVCNVRKGKRLMEELTPFLRRGVA